MTIRTTIRLGLAAALALCSIAFAHLAQSAETQAPTARLQFSSARTGCHPDFHRHARRKAHHHDPLDNSVRRFDRLQRHCERPRSIVRRIL